ncbi:MAG: glycosyl transferase family 2 [Gemmatimonadetes bacterium]|nr:glycosyl transferase family 2 [Gemmatimonadota bacterium]
MDNAPESAAIRDVCALFQARYIREPVTGLSRARNTGGRAATADVIVYIDDDARADPAWLKSLLLEFHDPRVAVVTGRCVPIPNSNTPEILDGMGRWWMAGLTHRTFDIAVPGWEEVAVAGGVGTGTSMAFRRGDFNEWTGFDERLGRGAPITSYEEHEAFLAYLLRGRRVVYTPDALVTHPVPDTWAAFERFRRDTRTAYVAYLLLLFAKHPAARGPMWRWLRRRLRRTGGEPAGGADNSESPFQAVRTVLKGIALFASAPRR